MVVVGVNPGEIRSDELGVRVGVRGEQGRGVGLALGLSTCTFGQYESG